jgi:small neutral amino acid transporter SnatA (MarC family)
MESGGYSPQYLPYTCSDPPFLVKIKGPGTVHFSANSTSRTYTDQKQKNFRLSVVFLLSVAILYLTLALLTKSSEVIDRLVDEELLAAFHANQP